METMDHAIKTADNIVSNSCHKMIYSYLDNRNLLTEQLRDYSSCIYINMDDFNKGSLKDKESRNYYSTILSREFMNLYIVKKILDHVDKTNDIKKNNIEDFLYKESCIRGIDCGKNFNDFLKIIDDSYNIYLDTYLNYIKTGKFENPYNKLKFVMSDLFFFIKDIKFLIDKSDNFSLVFDNNTQTFYDIYYHINGLISNKCNKDFSINVLTDFDMWPTYSSASGEFIENIHDYLTVEYDSNYDDMKLLLYKNY